MYEIIQFIKYQFEKRRVNTLDIIAHTMKYNGTIKRSLLTLRNYMDSDNEKYKEIYNDCFSEMRIALGLSPKCCDSREILLDKCKQVYIYEKDGVFIGAISIYENEIDDLIVAKEFQRKGYGNELLNFAISNMQRNKISLILLHVADWNQGAIKLYEKNNFEIIKTEIVN